MDRRDDAGILCRSCSYGAVLEDVGSEGKKRDRRAQFVPAGADQGPSLARRIAGAVVLLAVAAVIGTVSVPRLLAAFPDERPYAIGAQGSDDDPAPGLSDCLEGLWRVRAAMDVYIYENKGKVPARLPALKDVPRECPGCESGWRYRATATTYRVACPNPGKHGRAAVFLDHRVGPPQVALDASSVPSPGNEGQG